MSKQEFMKVQTCVLRVNIHCDGCKQKVKKLLQKIDGVFSVAIDSDQGKVTVSGSADPDTLIKKLEKNGKHAELWGFQKGPAQNQNQFQNLQNQFKNLQLDGGKVGKLDRSKSQNGGGGGAGGGKEQLKGGGQHAQLQQQQLQHLQQMMVPMMGNVNGPPYGPKGMIDVHAMNDKKSSGSVKKGGTVDFPIEMMKGKGNGNHEGKNGNGGKKSGGNGKGGSGNSKGGKSKPSGDKNGEKKKSGGLRALFGFGKKSSTKEGSVFKKGGSNNGGGDKKSNNGKGGGGKQEKKKMKNDFDDFDIDFATANHGKGGGKGGKGSGAGGGGGGKMGQMGEMGRGGGGGVMGRMGPSGPVGQNGGGRSQMGMGPMGGSYPMMNGSGMPAVQVNYASHPVSDNYTHVFSDENTESCNVM
ncbi:hypothetical protein F8388_018964 [Cannabis sativa]|uniref:HMA domain-containing protein n=1 Tax=Cannabis sativa TaxID=3483 RepID=A0A7J6ETU4_CANSA|nr:hypothetical protein F8388_018964 [Cannabis sativa]